jgi:hypothetical protein
MRYLWLWMLFALPVSPELQVDISGRAFDSQGQSFGTFAVSFDVDTLSGTRSTTSTVRWSRTPLYRSRSQT